MADVRRRFKSEILPIRVESSRLILPEDVGARVDNMYLTEEGTLRSVWGPVPYVPDYGSGYPTYTNMKGVFHARVGNDGERDLLITQDNDKIRVFEGWNAATGTPWRNLIAPGGTAAKFNADFGSDDKPRFPCQFESTPNGVVIIPSGESSRAFFYDGDAVLPLGYASSPSVPVGLSPKSADDDWYNHTGVTMAVGGTVPSTFGQGRVGSVALDAVGTAQSGRINKGSYRAAVQWLDRWGNLSPLSGRSGPVIIPAVDADAIAATTGTADDNLHQIMWTSIQPGPDGTVGRILCRTQDEINSGTTKLFEVPAYVEHGFLSPATLPDNVTFSFPDNVADGWLVREPVEPVAVSPFKLYTLAFGRGWAANFDGDPGKLHPTMPGRWGTFLENEEIYPDPRGAEITGLCQVPEGLLVFTENTTFLVTVSYGGDGFQTRTIHPSVGCVAPSSIGMMPDGTAMWLGREGFFGYQGGQIALLSGDIDREVRSFNRSRLLQAVAAVDVREGKYRCWVAANGSQQNNVCWQYDASGWTQRDDVEAAGVCVTQDHRHYMIAVGRAQESGQSPTEGVWLLDHQVQSWVPTPRASMVQTSWLRAPYSQTRGSPLTVYLWLREMESGTINVEVERDWRAEVTQTATAPLHPADDFPPFWTTDNLGGVDADGDFLTWKHRRPYWTRVDIFVPSAEVFRLKITHTGAWEFIGMSFDETPHPDTFRSAPK